MMATALKRYTVDDYLALEEKAETKSEYFDGEIFAMVGGTATHNIILMNVSGLLWQSLKETPCRPFPSDMRVVCPTGLRTYPDVSVVCGDMQFTDSRTDEIHNPTVLFEVLSPTTEAYDRGKKFEHYQSIPSLREYLLVAQDRRHIDHFVRGTDSRWILDSYEDGQFTLTSVQCSLAVDDVYDGVEKMPTSATDSTSSNE